MGCGLPSRAPTPPERNSPATAQFHPAALIYAGRLTQAQPDQPAPRQADRINEPRSVQLVDIADRRKANPPAPPSVAPCPVTEMLQPDPPKPLATGSPASAGGLSQLVDITDRPNYSPPALPPHPVTEMLHSGPPKRTPARLATPHGDIVPTCCHSGPPKPALAVSRRSKPPTTGRSDSILTARRHPAMPSSPQSDTGAALPGSPLTGRTGHLDVRPPPLERRGQTP